MFIIMKWNIIKLHTKKILLSFVHLSCYYSSNDLKDENNVFILGALLPFNVKNHEIVASEDNKYLYTIGNIESVSNKDIYKFTCKNSITNCSWTKIPTQLQFGRWKSVAMTIPDTLAAKLCNWATKNVWIHLPLKVLFLIKASYDYFQYWFKSAHSNQINWSPFLVLW